METIFYSFKELIEAENFSASELAKTFNDYYVSPEDFKKFIEKHGDNNKLFIDLLVNLWDDFSCPDYESLDKSLEKDEQSNIFNLDVLYDHVNKWTSMVIDTSLIKFFRLSAKICAKYKNLEINGKSIDTKKYFTDLFSVLPKEFAHSKKEITSDIEEAIKNKLSFLFFIIEDINLDNKSIGNYFNQFLSLISIKGLESEDKYLYEFITSVLDQYFFSSDEKLRCGTDYILFSPLVMLCKITKKKLTKNKYCLKDKEFNDLVESLRKIYGDEDWIRSLHQVHDGNFLGFISKVLNNFKEAKAPEEKADEANEIKIEIFFKLLSLGISEAFYNGYRDNTFNFIFGVYSGHDNLFNFCLSREFFLMAFVNVLAKNLENAGLDLEKCSYSCSDSCLRPLYFLTSLCLLNYASDKNNKEALCKLNPEFAFYFGLVLAKIWNCDDFIYDKKEYMLEKLFSYNCGFLFAFLANEAIFDFNNATLEKYINSMKPDSEQKDKLKEMVLRISENIFGGDDDRYYTVTSFLETLNGFQSKEKKLDIERVRKLPMEVEEGEDLTYLNEESCKLAKDKLINFLVDANKECFGDLANKEKSILNEIKGDQKPVPKLLDNINKYKDKCMII